MADVDTSMNRDPEPTQETLLRIRDRMNRRLEAGEPVRVIRSANLLTTAWRSDVDYLEGRLHSRRPGRQLSVSEELAETGEHLGLDRVGLVVEVAEVLR